MKPIRTVLCPVDFTPISERELDLAERLAKRFDAALVLQHNLAIGAGLGVSWMYEKEHYVENRAREVEVRQRLATMLGRLPEDVRRRARAAITYGALDHCVQNLAEQAAADLIVIGTHGRSGPDRPSETDRLVTHAPCPVLTTYDDAPEEWLPALGAEARINAVVPIDFSTHAMQALRYALDLREELPLDLTAFYVVEREDRGADWAEEQLAKAIPVDCRRSIKLETTQGGPVEEILLEEILLGAHLLFMGAHVKGFVERLLSRGVSTAREVLHRSFCPVWFVPASARV
jgi:universal stress protein A